MRSTGERIERFIDEFEPNVERYPAGRLEPLEVDLVTPRHLARQRADAGEFSFDPETIGRQITTDDPIESAHEFFQVIAPAPDALELSALTDDVVE